MSYHLRKLILLTGVLLPYANPAFAARTMLVAVPGYTQFMYIGAGEWVRVGCTVQNLQPTPQRVTISYLGGKSEREADGVVSPQSFQPDPRGPQTRTKNTTYAIGWKTDLGSVLSFQDWITNEMPKTIKFEVDEQTGSVLANCYVMRFAGGGATTFNVSVNGNRPF